MSTQLDIVYKLKEALETANPEVAIPFMADDFTHQTPPTQYVSLVYPRTSSETGTYSGRYPTRLGAPRRTRDQYSMEGACRRDQLQLRLKPLRVGTCISCGFRTQKFISATPQFEILDIIDNPGSITFQVSCSPTRYRGARLSIAKTSMITLKVDRALRT